MSDAVDRLKSAIADRYRIERPLGQGGMATVYLAQDLKHDRQVALKVLKPELAAVLGAERFVVEIKTTASLQHPHILPLFDSGTADGFLYYVMPYIEGETLRGKLNRESQFGVDEAVRIASQVADALDYAHRHGVIHRDIKPENILLHDGRPMVADFGIALAVSAAAGGRMTETGLSLGTPHYMSPEQATAEKDISGRSDIYSLGSVLYEMLTGEPPHSGGSAQQIIMKIIVDTPRPVTELRRSVPPNVAGAVARSLEKLPADRFATAMEFSEALRNPFFATASTAVRPGPGALWPSGVRRFLPALTAVAGVVLGGLGVAIFGRNEPAPVIRYSLSMPAGQAPVNEAVPVASPDGSLLAFLGPGDGGPQIWIKRRNEREAAPLPGTARTGSFTWAPDGQWIAFTSGLQLRKIPVVGGAAITLNDSASGNSGVAWLDDGTIVFPRAGLLALNRISAAGGPVSTVVTSGTIMRFPAALPGSRAVLYMKCGRDCGTEADAWVVDLRSGESREVIPGAVRTAHVPTGHLVYARHDGAMLAAPFNLSSLKTTGQPVPVLDGVLIQNRVFPLFSISESGTLAVRLGNSQALLARHQMVWVDRSGRESPVDPDWTFRFTEFGANVGWSLSPDGRRLAIGLNTEAGDDIWVKQLPRGPLSRVSFDSAADYRPRWMSDGRTVSFQSNRLAGGGLGGLYLRSADGTGRDSMVQRAVNGVFEAVWSPDRSWIVFRTGGIINAVGGRDVVGLRVGRDTAPVTVLATPFDEEAVALSPNGRWMAYESNETGRTEVFIRPFPATETGKWQVSNEGGVAPLWSRDGRELFYVNARRDMAAVTVESGPQPVLGERRRLFHLPDEMYLASPEFYTPFDVAPDGRFIMARRLTPVSALDVPVVITENWFEELRQKVSQ